jgi:hypothetical protein
VAALLTLAIFSFVFKYNSLTKLAEHVFIGVGTGYQIARTFNDSIYDKAYKPLMDPPPGTAPDWWVIVPAVLGALTLLKIIPSLAFWSRWPIAFVAGVTMGLAIITNLQSNVVEQVGATIKPFRFIDEAFREHTWRLTTQQDLRARDKKKLDYALEHNGLPADEEKKIDEELAAEVHRRKLLLVEAAGKLAKSGCADRAKEIKLLGVTVAPAFKNQEEIPVEPVLNWVASMRAKTVEEVEAAAKPALDLAPEVPGTGAGGPPPSEALQLARRRITDHYGTYFAAPGAPGGDVPPERQLILPAVVDRIAADQGRVPVDMTFKHHDWKRVVDAILIALGVLSGLVYFFFSKEHTGLVFGGLARVGVWFLMVAFGGSFGYTVMGRISLLIGRIQFLVGDWLHLLGASSGIVPNY